MFIQPKEPLETHSRLGFLEAAQFQTLFQFNHLMQTAVPRTHRHLAPRRFIDDDDFAFFNHILATKNKKFLRNNKI